MKQELESALGMAVASCRVVRKTWLQLACGALLASACLVVAPLDDVNHTTAATPDAAAGSGATGGAGGADGSGGTGGGGDASECTTNQECSDAAGARFRCLDGTCVALTTPECPIVRGRPEDKDAIFLGAFAGFDKTGEPGEDDVTWNYELALNEFNADHVGGLPYPTGQRRLAMVVCDAGGPTDDPEVRSQRVLAATKHLTENVRVPAVIAALESGDLLDAFDDYGAEHGVFFLTPGPATRVMLDVRSQDLLWHMLGLPADQAPVYAALLAVLEAHVKKLRQLDRKIKVALVTTDEAYDLDLEEAADDLLMFNGQNLAANRAENLYRDVTLPSNASADGVKQAVDDIIDFRPDIVISIAGAVFASDITAQYPAGGVLRQIEAHWGTLMSGPRPYYVLSPNNYPSSETAIIPIIEFFAPAIGEPEMHKRFIGINIAGSEDGDLYNEYRARLLGHERSATGGSENYYDAVYFTAYAIFAAGPQPSIFGTNVDSGIRKLITGGPELKVGPDDLRSVFQELAKPPPNGRIRLHGVLGPPRFDGNYGVRVDTGALYCFERPAPTASLEPHTQVGYYDRDAATPHLRVSRLFANRTLPCLQELGLPQP